MELIVTKGNIPTREFLVEILNSKFANNGYSAKLFGWGLGKSVMISKSAFTGVRIQIDGRKLKIDGSYGSLWALTFFGWLIFLFSSSWKEMENEVYQFLKTKYQ